MGGALLRVRNVLKAWLLLAGLCGAFAGVGYAAGGYRLLPVFVFCALLLAGATYLYSDRVALGMIGARELLPGQLPGLHSSAERLALRAGIAKPRLYVIRDGHPRALAAGRGVRGAAIAFSEGFLNMAPPAELEGVLAHELAHVRNRDV